MFSLRAGAKNFTHDDLMEASRLVHERGKKLYITANITAHEYDLKGVREYFEELKEVKPDALIVSDPGIMSIQREILPDIPIHVSTQANNVNSADFRFWHDAVGATRVVGGRELSLNEIKRIRSEIPDDLEIEAFVHGAMCISYSGRCLLSNYFTGRDANLGQCTHPCRWKYYVVEEKRPGEYIPVEENERGTQTVWKCQM
jgi:putative protease